ncbi:hypothetical protein V6R85_24180 [Agrobacterium sp. CCNWLW32]|uniref:hypothetical protein n=1 Tax=Agrobacterium sp. CCNWLW32 TaxID=3122072 RepID=UPI00300FDC34
MTKNLHALFDVEKTIARTNEFGFISEYVIHDLHCLRTLVANEGDEGKIETLFEIAVGKLQVDQRDAWDRWEWDDYKLFDIETPALGAPFSDLRAVRSLFDDRNRELGKFALQVPTDDQLRLIEEDALLSLQDSGLPEVVWQGVSGAYFMPAPPVGPYNGWKLSLLYSDRDWHLDRIAVGGGGRRLFRGFLLQVSDNRIQLLEQAGLPTRHFSRQKDVRMTDGDGNVSYRTIWTLPEATRSIN